MSDNKIIKTDDDREFEQMLADQQHEQLVALFTQLMESLTKKDSRDTEILAMIIKERSAMDAFMLKIKELVAPTVKVEPAGVTVHANHEVVVKAISDSTETLLQSQQQTQKLLKELIDLRSKDIELIATRGPMNLIEKVIARIKK